MKQQHGPDEPSDSGEDSFERFVSGVDTWLHGFTSLPELLKEFEDICRGLAELVREEAAEKQKIEFYAKNLNCCIPKHRAWHLYGMASLRKRRDNGRRSRRNHVCYDRERVGDETRLRLVQWHRRNSTWKKEKRMICRIVYSKLWDQTKRAIRKNVGTNYVRHLDPDVPTREGSEIHPEDQKLEDGLLEDVWKLIRAGRIADAQELCRPSGQAWRAASLGGCLTGYSPTIQQLTSELSKL